MIRNTFTLITFSLFFSTQILAQNQSELPLSIREDGTNPDPSAMLDVQSTTKGMLVPRMTTAQRTIIATPATGLLIFDMNTTSFWFFDGSTWVDLSANSGGTDDQTLSIFGTDLSIEDGNTVDLSIIQDGVIDADADPNNEIQDLSNVLNEGNDAGGKKITNLTDPTIAQDAATKNYVDSNDAVNDADADPTNELQNLSLSGTIVNIENGTGVDLAPIIPPGGTDDQMLTLTGTNLEIEDGNTVDLSVIQDGVNDADADPTNELQNLSLSGTIINIENGTGVDLAPIIPPGGTDDQMLTLTGTNLEIEDGNTVDLSVIQDGVNDADADPTNEIQNLDDVLSQSNDANAAAITNLADPTNAQDAATKNYVDSNDAVDDADADPTNEIQNLDEVLSQSNDANAAAITNLAEPTNAQDAATKNYVDSNDAVDDADADPTNEIQNLDEVLSQSNDANAAAITNLADPTNTQDAATKNYVDSNDAVDDADANPTNEIQNLDEVLSQSNDANAAAITNLADPTNAQDAATKNYVDSNDAVDDADADPTNEIQTLSITGNDLSISSGNTLTLPTSSILEDADNDTKIQVEESADDDIIRFDIAGTEFGSMDGKTFHLEAPGSSLFIGTDAGLNDDGSDNNNNTFIGIQTGQSNTSGQNNTFIGRSAGKDNTTGWYNTFIGVQSGLFNTSGASNTFIGGNAGFSNTIGGANTFIGQSAGQENTSGLANTFIGRYAGLSNTTGVANTFIGESAGLFNTSGGSNTFIGRDAGKDNLIGSGNVFLGRSAGQNETGSDKLYIENSNADSTNALIYGEFDNNFLRINGNLIATEGLTDADNDTKIQVEESTDDDIIRFDIAGTEFGSMDGKTFHLEAPGSSLFIGTDAGQNDDESDNKNTFIGNNAGQANTTGYWSTYIGERSGFSNTTGFLNTFIGVIAGRDNTSGHSNTFIGVQAGSSNTTGSTNTFVGKDAGNENITGIENTFIGVRTGFSNTSGDSNTFIGREAGKDNLTGSRNVFLGNAAGENETGSDKLYIDNSDTVDPLLYGEFDNDILRINGKLNATEGFTDADNDTKIQVEESADDDIIRFDIAGTEFGSMDGKTFHLEAPGGSLFIGTDAGQNDDGTNNQNTFIGVNAGQANITGGSNTFTGRNAGQTNTAGGSNTFTGRDAGQANTTGGSNTFTGRGAGQANTTGGENTFMGNDAGLFNISGSENVFIGDQAGQINMSGSGNVFIGKSAGQVEMGSNKLYIENSSSPFPLIYGEFDNDILRINGTLEVGNEQLGDVGTNSLGISGDIIPLLTTTNFDLGNNTAGESWDDVVGDDFVNVSDARRKKNVQSLNYGLTAINQLRPVTYQYIHEPDYAKPSPGLIAQEVLNIIPEVVKTHEIDTDKNGQVQRTPVEFLGINYVELVPILINGMQEQQELIEVQKTEIETQKIQIKTLENQLEQISKALSKAGIEMD